MHRPSKSNVISPLFFATAVVILFACLLNSCHKTECSTVWGHHIEGRQQRRSAVSQLQRGVGGSAKTLTTNLRKKSSVETAAAAAADLLGYRPSLKSLSLLAPTVTNIQLQYQPNASSNVVANQTLSYVSITAITLIDK